MSAFVLAAEKFWILDPLYAAFGFVLAWFYAVIPSFGMAIILLTVAVSILRMPLVAKQVKSQQEMQRIQPELKRIQVKYKNDPQKRNEEMMKLYKEHSVNPFASCLPLLLQMPLFIVLYRMILGLGEARPKHIPRTSNLFEALQESGGEMQSFGMDLAEAASKVTGLIAILPYLVLIALVVATGLFQQRQMTARLPKDAQSNQMAMIGKIFPAFLGLISWSIPAGVVLYFFVSNLWQIGQQAVLFRRQEAQKAAEEASRAADKAADKAARSGKGGKPKELPGSDGSEGGTDGADAETVAGPAGASARDSGGKKPGQANSARSGNASKAGKGRGAGKSGAAAGGGSRPAAAKDAPGKAGAGKAGAGRPPGGKAASGKPPGRGLLGLFGGGSKATGRNDVRSGRKPDRRPNEGKDGSGPNGRSSSRGASGRAQPKGTNPQGRSRKGK